MADEEQLRIFMQGVDTWNKWRRQAGDIRIDLSGTYSPLANLTGIDLRGADLSRVKFQQADISGGDLREVTLRDADLAGVILRGTRLGGANFEDAYLWETNFINVDLSGCIGLENCRYGGPSPVDFRTLRGSGPLPLAFLRGVGLPDKLIEYLPSLLGQAIQHYSCFISYSSENGGFARRLHADLQNNGVRCWFAPEDMKIGSKLLDALDQAIQLRDKVLLVLSEASIASEWVEDEVTKAFEEERQRGCTVLFPVRLDDAVFATKEAWAGKLRSRHIGDFCDWKKHDAYQKALERVLRDLRVGSA
jgi:uncharacterized protein YjbI with pentapeptide repeats